MIRGAALVLVLGLGAHGCQDASHPPYSGGTRPAPPAVTPGPRDGAAAPDTGAADLGSPDAAAGCAVDPGTITVTGGDLVGATVAASAPIVGTIQLEVDRRDSCPACVFNLVTAGTWEDAASVASCDGPIAAAGPVTRVVTVSKLAPQTPGTYQLIIAGRADHGCLEVLSASTGAVVWGDGNDITDWPLSGIFGGSACVPWLSGGQIEDVRVPAATVEILVQ